MFPFTTTLNDRTVSSAQLDFLSPETFRLALDALNERRYHEAPDRPFTHSDSANSRLNLSPTPTAIICGYCNFPAAKHADLNTKWRKGRFVVHEDEDGFKQYCNRYAEDVTNPEVDFVRTRNISLPLQDNVQPEFDNDNSDQYHYEDANAELEKLDRYHDRSPEEHTVTLEQYRQGYRSTPNLEPESRNTYIEGQEGFTSIKVLDDILTRKYHARLLNIFINKQGKRQIGSVVLQDNTDGTRSAKCVKCKGVLNFPTDPTRAQMEEFTYAIISHGNNHAAKWYRERVEKGHSYRYLPSIPTTARKITSVPSPKGHVSPSAGKVNITGAYVQGPALTTDPLYYVLAPALPAKPDPDNDPAAEDLKLTRHYQDCRTVGCACVNHLLAVTPSK